MTAKHIHHFPTQTIRFQAIERPPELQGSVTALDTDGLGRIWIGVIGKEYAAIGAYDGNSWQHWQLNAGDITQQFVLFQNTVIRQGRTLHMLANDAWVPCGPPDPDDVIVSLCNQHDRALWAGTILNGLWFSPDTTSWTPIPQPSPIENALVHALACDPTGAILAAEVGTGLWGPHLIWRWADDSWQPLEPPPNRNFRCISTIIAPDSGDIWAFSFEGGLWHWDGMSWTHVNQPSQKANRIPSRGLSEFALAEAQDRVFVMSAQYGLLTRREGSWVRITSPDEVCSANERFYLHDGICGRIHTDERRLWIAGSTTTLHWANLEQFDQP